MIFVDELMTLGLGMYLARCGTWQEAIACATGGTLAAYMVLRKKKKVII